MIASALRQTIRSIDDAVAGVYLSLRRERGGVISFLFHALFRDEREIARNLIDPLERTTVAQFRQLVEYYLKHDYKFISPDQMLGGLDPRGKYALITFDDGYYNNILALPVLEEYKVPAVFFISTDHIRENKCYWWDVLYRERMAQGHSADQIYHESMTLKAQRTELTSAWLIKEFGDNALVPRGDIDRPFTPRELREFARSPFVHLGNHTAAHAILTNYTPEQIRAQVQDAQDSLFEMTGINTRLIAYPNGAFDETIIQICTEAGLKLGFTVQPQKIPLPLSSKAADLLRLARFVPHDSSSMNRQCRTYRSDLLLYGTFRHLYLRLRGSKLTQ